MANKKSFFEKLTGGIRFTSDDEYDVAEDTHDEYLDDAIDTDEDHEEPQKYSSSYEEVGELSVDMYKVSNAIIIKTMIAGIKKSEIDITLTRDQIRIEGSRYNQPEGSVEESYYEELYWGAFERVIELPEEVDIELAEAREEHGLLTLILPLIDRERQARLKIN